MIKAVICDLGGVYFQAGTHDAVKKFYRTINLPKEKIDEIFEGYPKKEGWLYRRGKLTKAEFWAAAIRKLKIDKKMVPKLQEIWHSSYKPVRGMKEIVAKLRKNYKIIVFSGTIRERIKYFDKKYNLLKTFDDFVFSFNAGFTKSEIGFYKVLFKKLKMMDLKSEECIFIDDHQEFLDKAKKFRIQTILFKNPQKLKYDLRKAGLKI